MFWSKSFIPTLKEDPQEAESVSHKLLLRAGLVRMLMAGVYSYLPLGLRVMENIQEVIREEMDACGANELLLPALQPLELWQKTGRDKDLGQVMFSFKDRRGRSICLGPTHEEAITDLVRSQVASYRQLPLVLYQIQTKFRDEIRPRFGLIRACEFIMKDAYSFDQDEAGLDKNYQAMFNAYKNIFSRLGLRILITEADSGVMGGKVSHEFMVPSKDGEDVVLLCAKCAGARTFKEEDGQECPKCKIKMEKLNCIEVGHIFKLGTKYSQAIQANFSDAKGVLKPIIMGCYGIGVSRLVSAVIEQNNDSEGIVWPPEVAPFDVVILPLDVMNADIMNLAKDIYQQVIGAGKEALLDDRDDRAGIKFKDADLLGIPVQVVIGRTCLKDNTVEIKLRSNNKEKIICPKDQALAEIKRLTNIKGKK
ncbi:MAG: proline--tRNA ligase [Candidatus Omnitrophica bacterium]|nr:proline--tRNA ligase [Candidatus Omnitrophota bacterium]MDD5690192.1 proline--tRNA ligase [Candidatus Omnitrophota bacterium]